MEGGKERGEEQNCYNQNLFCIGTHTHTRTSCSNLDVHGPTECAQHGRGATHTHTHTHTIPLVVTLTWPH